MLFLYVEGAFLCSISKCKTKNLYSEIPSYFFYGVSDPFKTMSYFTIYPIHYHYYIHTVPLHPKLLNNLAKILEYHYRFDSRLWDISLSYTYIQLIK